MHPAFQGLLTIVIGVGACLSYFYFSNQFLDKVLFPAREETRRELVRARFGTCLVLGVPFFALAFMVLRPLSTSGELGFDFVFILGDWFAQFSVKAPGIVSVVSAISFATIVSLLLAFASLKIFPPRASSAGRNINRANLIRPWLFLFPALFALSLYLAYPVFETLRLSLTDRDAGGAFVGLDNYRAMMQQPKFWEAMINNMLWLLVVPAMATGFGLLAAQLTDRLKWGNVAKSLIFMPMAISFVGAAVIWKLVYDARPAGAEQIGVVNAIYTWLTGNDPVQLLTVPFWNNFFLMIVLVWIQTGFAMVILSAALRGIPEETIEAAIVDGANPFQIFFKIKVPQIMGTILVVWTTITLTVLKVFDIVFAMTNGQWGTQVLANYMFNQMFVARDWGVGSASAIVIMILVLPILVWNVRNVRKEMR